MTDVVILVPDRNIEFAVRGILARRPSLGIRAVTTELHTHPAHDPGCFANGPEFLQFAVRKAAHALVVFDHHGSGQDHTMDRAAMEADVERRLAASGWDGRCAAIVISPELENWVWSTSPHVDAVLGWSGRVPPLRSWLQQQGRWAANDAKPAQPKEALLDAIRAVGKSRTSKLYSDLAGKVGFNQCTDEAFVKLCRVLRAWFSDGDGRQP
jgi:hypothetical protein